MCVCVCVLYRLTIYYMYIHAYICYSGYIPLRVGYHCYYTSPEAKPRTSVNNNDILRV